MEMAEYRALSWPELLTRLASLDWVTPTREALEAHDLAKIRAGAWDRCAVGDRLEEIARQRGDTTGRRLLQDEVHFESPFDRAGMKFWTAVRDKEWDRALELYDAIQRMTLPADGCATGRAA